MRDTLEYNIDDPKHSTIAIVPLAKGYKVTLDGIDRYGGTSFSLDEAKSKIDFLRSFLKIDTEPIRRAQDGSLLAPKRKRRTKAEMAEEKRLKEASLHERKSHRANRSIPKKLSGNPPTSKKHRRKNHRKSK